MPGHLLARSCEAEPLLQADPPRQAVRGLHFILGQARLPAAVRLSQKVRLCNDPLA